MRGQPVSPSCPLIARSVAALYTTLVLAFSGCATPFDGAPTTPLEQSIAAAIDRELASLHPSDPRRVTTQPPGEVEETLKERRDELEALGPATEASRTPVSLGADLAGNEQTQVTLTLADATSRGHACESRIN